MNSNQLNKVVNVNRIGGLIGLFGDNTQTILDNAVKKQNKLGYKVVQVIPANTGNILLFVFRIFLLLITIFFYTTLHGYYLILEKTESVEDASLNQSGTQEPAKQEKPNVDDLFN